MTPREELQQHIAARLTGIDQAEAQRLAGEVLAMAYEVDDEWIHHDVTQLGDDGKVWLVEHWLVARCPIDSHIQQASQDVNDQSQTTRPGG